nr:CDP-diacylglycerol--glycerol-3-phosphate 3-phosphatidyltransferase [uncultured Oscillibacter sp.]
MNLPNKLTLMRIILTPVFMAVLYWGFPGADYAALAIFIIASLTDLLDGKIARKYHLVTDFGKFADPLADKILVTAAMLWFVEVGRMPAWALLVVLLREFAVSGLRMIASDKGRVIAAGWSGKVKTASTMVCIIVMLLLGPEIAWAASDPLTAVPIGWLRWIDPVCVWVIVLTTLYSGVEYFVKNRDVIASA